MYICIMYILPIVPSSLTNSYFTVCFFLSLFFLTIYPNPPCQLRIRYYYISFDCHTHFTLIWFDCHTQSGQKKKKKKWDKKWKGITHLLCQWTQTYIITNYYIWLKYFLKRSFLKHPFIVSKVQSLSSIYNNTLLVSDLTMYNCFYKYTSPPTK